MKSKLGHRNTVGVLTGLAPHRNWFFISNDPWRGLLTDRTFVFRGKNFRLDYASYFFFVK